MEIYTAKETADILKMTIGTVKRYIYDGDLKAYKIGREWRIKKQDLDEFMFKDSNIGEK